MMNGFEVWICFVSITCYLFNKSVHVTNVLDTSYKHVWIKLEN